MNHERLSNILFGLILAAVAVLLLLPKSALGGATITLQPGESVTIIAAPATQPSASPPATKPAPAPATKPATAPAVKPSPAPVPTPKKVPNAANAFAHDVLAAANVTISDELITAGGILRAEHGAKSITLNRVAGTGDIHGAGVYRVLLASAPVESFTWDNTGIDTEIVSGDEAALRVMGGAETVTITNVNFRCRKHDDGDDTGQHTGTPGKKQVFWKQAQQWRDVRKALVQGGRTIGPIDVGEQKNTAATPQRVDELRFVNHQMTTYPTVTDRKTIGVVTLTHCEKIDEQGNVIGMWPDGPLK